MDKAIFKNVLTSVVTAAILGISAYFMGAFQDGSTALDDKKIDVAIEAAIKKAMDTEGGATIKATLSELALEAAVLETRVTILKTEVEGLEDTVFDLVSD
jgi:hypothetical protein